MRLQGFFLLFLLGPLFLGASSHEHFLQNQELPRLKAIALILCGDEGVERLDLSNHRIYLDPGRIVVTDCGIFYFKGCQEILLPELFSDHLGCFLRCTWEDLSVLSEIEELQVWWCRGCNRLREMDRFGRCCRCGRLFF